MIRRNWKRIQPGSLRDALRLCKDHALERKNYSVERIAAPGADGEDYDRLYASAQQSGIPAEICGRRVEAEHIPIGVDVIIAAHAHAFITEGARLATRYGALGYHPSLLPRHRGRDAVRWTVHMGDPIAGGTVYWMDDGADTGPIAAQDWCFVRPDDDSRSLWRRELAPMGIRLFEKVLNDLGSGFVMSSPQQSYATTWEPSFTSSKLSKA